MPKQLTKIPVTLRALEARINRALAKRERKLIRCRSEALRQQFGSYVVVDLHNGTIDTKTPSDPLALGRQLGCWHEYEDLHWNNAANLPANGDVHGGGLR